MNRPFVPYEWPEDLYPLRDWMKRKGVDVGELKTERQAAWMAKQLGKQTVKLSNDRGKSLFPALLKMQNSLCPKGQRSGSKEKGTRKERYIPGTFGAASPVRHIDPSTYEVKS